MNWTKDKPTKDGWYWSKVRPEANPEVVMVDIAYGVSLCGFEEHEHIESSYFNSALWYGPLTPPELPNG